MLAETVSSLPATGTVLRPVVGDQELLQDQNLQARLFGSSPPPGQRAHVCTCPRVSVRTSVGLRFPEPEEHVTGCQ